MRLATWFGMVFMTYNYGSTFQFVTVLAIGIAGYIGNCVKRYKEIKNEKE